MKIKSIFTALILKAFLIVVIVTVGLSGFVKCDAQSVVGKWSRSFAKLFTLDKATGKQVPVSAEMQQKYDAAVAENGYKETLELKTDNTYVSTVVSKRDPKPTIRNGKYSLSGKNLDMNIPLVNNQKTTITILLINSTTMVWDLLFMGKQTEITYTKI